MRTLIINAHPLPSNANSYSNKLHKAFCDLFYQKFPKDELEILNLADEYIPELDEKVLNIWTKQSQGIDLNSNEQKIASRMDEILTQFKRCHRIVISMPLHNFNISSKLKSYFDNILIAKQTFKYVTGGSVGLMTDDRKVLLMQASGAIYTLNDRYTQLDFSVNYVKGMFVEIMGFNDFDVVRLQGTSVGAIDKEQALNDAVNEIKQKFEKFY